MISPEYWARVFAWALQHTLRQPRESHNHWKERVFQVAKQRIEDERAAWSVAKPAPLPVEKSAVVDFSQSIAELRSELLHSKQTKLNRNKRKFA